MRSIEHRRAADGAVKHVLQLEDGLCVEAVWIPQRSGVNLCVSCQVGCPNKCKHCATALVSFERDLTAREIYGEVRQLLDEHGDEAGPTRVLFMGMGEPLLNLANVMEAIGEMCRAGAIAGFGDVIVSTSGIVPGIRSLGREAMRPRLAVTLGAVPDQKRALLIPTTKLFPLAELLSSRREYQEQTGDDLIFEIPLIDGINASTEDAKAMAARLLGYRCEVQIVPFNRFPGSSLREPSPSQIREVASVLEAVGLKVSVKPSYGRDIQAGCGQLAITRSQVCSPKECQSDER